MESFQTWMKKTSNDRRDGVYEHLLAICPGMMHGYAEAVARPPMAVPPTAKPPTTVSAMERQPARPAARPSSQPFFRGYQPPPPAPLEPPPGPAAPDPDPQALVNQEAERRKLEMLAEFDHQSPDYLNRPGAVTFTFFNGQMYFSPYPDTHYELDVKYGLPAVAGKVQARMLNLHGTYAISFWGQPSESQLIDCARKIIQQFPQVTRHRIFVTGKNLRAFDLRDKLPLPPVETADDTASALNAEREGKEVEVMGRTYKIKQLPALLHTLPKLSPERQAIERYLRSTDDPEAADAKDRVTSPGGGQKHPWQAAMQKAGLLGPGQRWWAPTSEATSTSE